MHYNIYDKELSLEDISRKKHREFVGGLWEEMGALQFDFLLSRGLQETDKVLDLGCGALRGGIRILEFLQKGHYFGLDINRSLLEAAHVELMERALEFKNPKLMLSSNFNIQDFGLKFDFILSVSLFTHLPFPKISECLNKIRDSLELDGLYFSSFFEAENSQFANPVEQKPSSIISYPDKDPFHQTFASFEKLGQQTGLNVSYIGDWRHPRNQKMVCFSRTD
jgi:cyclopropane fatty-acyl-phospholipid synthase-like methyltransferase